MNRIYRGGCHCGALRVEVELDLSVGITKCNCTYCAISRFWFATVDPEDFRASGEATDYRGRIPVARHLFCPRCGVHVYDHIDAPNMLGRPYICLEDVNVDELVAAPVRYCDGLNDDWGSTPKETRLL